MVPPYAPERVAPLSALDPGGLVCLIYDNEVQWFIQFKEKAKELRGTKLTA